jgi:hypothetical protein
MVPGAEQQDCSTARAIVRPGTPNYGSFEHCGGVGWMVSPDSWGNDLRDRTVACVDVVRSGTYGCAPTSASAGSPRICAEDFRPR